MTNDDPKASEQIDESVAIGSNLAGVDWHRLKADVARDDFDNGRSPDALRRSFEASEHVAIARDGDRVVGTARLLSDGVCNAYLVDVWTAATHRRRGVATALVGRLMGEVPGQHIGLQVDDEGARRLYRSLGFRAQPEFLSIVVGDWLDNEANR